MFPFLDFLQIPQPFPSPVIFVVYFACCFLFSSPFAYEASTGAECTLCKRHSSHAPSATLFFFFFFFFFSLSDIYQVRCVLAQFFSFSPQALPAPSLLLFGSEEVSIPNLNMPIFRLFHLRSDFSSLIARSGFCHHIQRKGDISSLSRLLILSLLCIIQIY